MATYREKRGTTTVPIVAAVPDTGVNGEIVYITGEGLASYNGGTWSKLTASAVWKQAGQTYCYTYGSSESDHNQKSVKITIASDAIAESGSNTLSVARNNPYTGKSITAGYIISGQANYLDKQTFASDTYAAVNNTTQYDHRGGSSMSDTTCYQYGGSDLNNNSIYKLTYSSETQATYGGTISDHTSNKYAPSISSDTHGIVGARFVSASSPTRTRNIHQFSFASEGNTTSLGTMSSTSGQQLCAGSRSSDGRGFSVGGFDGLNTSVAVTNIEQITFASGASANFGNSLLAADQGLATPFTDSVSYLCGGFLGSYTTFDKFSHTSGTSTTDIGTNYPGGKYASEAGLGS